MKTQQYVVIDRDAVLAAIDSGKFIPVQAIFTDDRGQEIGRGEIRLVDKDEMVRKKL